MKDKLIKILHQASEEIRKLKDRFIARIEANTNDIHRSYWALPPETRARILNYYLHIYSDAGHRHRLVCKRKPSCQDR